MTQITQENVRCFCFCSERCFRKECVCVIFDSDVYRCSFFIICIVQKNKHPRWDFFFFYLYAFQINVTSPNDIFKFGTCMLKLCSLLFLLFFCLCPFSPAVWSVSKCSAESSNRRPTQTQQNPGIWPCLGVVGRRGASSPLRTCTASARSLKPRLGQRAALGQKQVCKPVGRGRKEKRMPWLLRFWRRHIDWLSGGDLSFT